MLVAPGMATKLVPASVLTCHWIAGAGLPVAADVKETEVPGHADWLAGFKETVGAALTVTAALPEPLFEQLASATRVTV